MQQSTIRDMFLQMGYKFEEMPINEPIVPSGKWEIKSFDIKTKQVCWKQIKQIVRKQATKAYALINHDTLEQILIGAPEHKVYAFVRGVADYIELVALSDFDHFSVMSENGKWISAFIKVLDTTTEIADVEIDDTHCYISNGIVSHNTLYGDPCLAPEMHVIVRSPDFVEKGKTCQEEMTLKELANRFGITDLSEPQVLDIIEHGYEVESWDEKEQRTVWKPITDFVVKESSDIHYQLGNLAGAAEHRVLYRGNYIALKNHPEALLVEDPIQVVDISVADTHNYFSEGQINHNTTTPGGLAIPFFSSIRIKLTGGQVIEDTDSSDKRIIGINVTAKCIKDKVAPPFRSCDFEIHFGKGIKEHEQLFDVLRAYCDESGGVVKDGKKTKIEGMGPWKTITVSDEATGEVILEQKFYKNEFNKIMFSEHYRPYVEDLVEAAMTIKMGEPAGIPDEDSYVEMEADAIEKLTT